MAAKPDKSTIDLPDEVVADLQRRLRRVGGQIAGIQRMLDERRECRDVLTQISAANRALEQAAFKLLSAGLTYCLSNPDEAAAAGYPLEEVERLFLKLA